MTSTTMARALIAAATLAYAGCSPAEPDPGATARAPEVVAAEALVTELHGAQRVVVGRVVDVTAAHGTNEHGDHVILSTVTVGVDESLRGDAPATLSFEMEGGTVGELTLEVSDLPKLSVGDRAVFALRPDREGIRWVPHRRGRGIVRLDTPDATTRLAALRGAWRTGR